MVSINKYEIPSTISERRARQTPSDSTKSDVWGELSLMKGDEKVGYIKNQAGKRIVAERPHSINRTVKKKKEQ